MENAPNRCRLVLAVEVSTVKPGSIEDALAGGDVASILLYSADPGFAGFEACCKAVTGTAQARDVAVIVVDDTQVFGRSGADGIMAEREKPQLADLVARFSPQNIVGCGNIKSRHQAMQMGELKPDFLFLGKLGGDIRPEPYHKNLALAQWWAELVEISAIVMGGNETKSVVECAETGAEFVALEKAVFANEAGPEAAVREVNALLDAHAPVFEDDEG